MPSFTTFISLFMGIVFFLIGTVLGQLFSKTESISRLSGISVENDSEKRLRTEVRDDISRIILEILESGEEPTLLYIAELCPKHFRTGSAWTLWQRESHQMLKQILAKDLTIF